MKNYNIPPLADKSAFEKSWTGIPELSLYPSSNPEIPTFVDKQNCGKEYQVEDGMIYTIRLGMHSDPGGLGAFTKSTLATCMVPTAISRRQVITAFFPDEHISPAVFMDYIYLRAEHPFLPEIIKGSVLLESNNGETTLHLGDDS